MCLLTETTSFGQIYVENLKMHANFCWIDLNRNNIDTKLSRAASEHGLKIGFSSFFGQPTAAKLRSYNDNFYTKQQHFVQGSALTLPLLYVLHCF